MNQNEPRIKEITIYRKKKKPIEGVQFSSSESFVSMTIQVPTESQDISKDDWDRYCHKLNNRLEELEKMDDKEVI